jgi:hypothetical protein
VSQRMNHDASPIPLELRQQTTPQPDPVTDLITDEMVEAAAEAVAMQTYGYWKGKPGLSVSTRGEMREDAAAALTAALPLSPLSATIERQAAEIERLNLDLDIAVDAREHFKWDLHRLTHVVTEPGCEHCAAALALPQEREET